jgi:hypothetical protein
MTSRFVWAALAVSVSLGTPLQAAEEQVDPNNIDIVDAIECRLDAPAYMGFALALNGEEKIAQKRRWVRVDTKNSFMNEYELPAPITVAGHYSTRRIAFTSNGVLAILDLADSSAIAREQDVKNALDPGPLIDAMIASGKVPRDEIDAKRFRKFLGEKVTVDRTEPPAAGDSFGTHTIIARNVSNATTHPGKTFYGCTYRIELIGKDGRPL